MADASKSLCPWCDVPVEGADAFCAKCTRMLTVDVIHQHSRQVGPVNVTFTVGRIGARKDR